MELLACSECISKSCLSRTASQDESHPALKTALSATACLQHSPMLPKCRWNPAASGGAVKERGLKRLARRCGSESRWRHADRIEPATNYACDILLPTALYGAQIRTGVQGKGFGKDRTSFTYSEWTVRWIRRELRFLTFVNDAPVGCSPH